METFNLKIIKEINEYFYSKKYDFDYEVDEDYAYYNISLGSKILSVQLEFGELIYAQVYIKDLYWVESDSFGFVDISDFLCNFEDSMLHFRNFLSCRKKILGLMEEIRECILEANIGLDADEVCLNIDL